MPENRSSSAVQSPESGGATRLTLETGRRHTIVLPPATRIDTLLPASGAGYYCYGPADHRYGQAHVVAAITAFASRWAEDHPDWTFGIGDLSRRGGGDTPRHSSHENGLNIDVRPLRGDGLHQPVIITERAYSRERTRALVEGFLAIPEMDRILFNDRAIRRVRWWEGHHNHLHLIFKPAS
jgi:murein endopeptidase